MNVPATLEEAQMVTPTEYRIVPIIYRDTLSYYLQFRFVRHYTKRSFPFFQKRKYTEDSWRFVFENPNGVHSNYLYPSQCPERLCTLTLDHFKCIRAFQFQEVICREFVKRWPYIDDYYANARQIRMDREEKFHIQCENAQIVYLTQNTLEEVNQ